MSQQSSGAEKQMILFVNACVREQSRTKQIAEYLLSILDDDIMEVKLKDTKFPMSDETFLNQREEAAASGDFHADMFAFARDFASADTVVIAAPYWDLSFPAVLKQYLEQVTVNGITFRYSEEGIPQGLCRARKLYYITTAGGPSVPVEYGYGYVRELAQSYYGIPETVLIKAEGLDIVGADVDEILEETKKKI